MSLTVTHQMDVLTILIVGFSYMAVVVISSMIGTAIKRWQQK
jgi:hypothetical protein